VSARRFVQLIIKLPRLADDDLARSLEIVNAQPAKVGKAAELARAAANAVPQPGVLLRWCEEVVRSRDESLWAWALDPTQNGRAAFGELLTWVSANIGTKKDRVNESCLSLGLGLLLARRSLTPLDALRSIASARAGHRDARRSASPVSGCENPRKDGGELDRWAENRRCSGWVRVI
jgi:hypothetical protein